MRSSCKWFIFKAHSRTPTLARAKLKVLAGTVPGKRGAGKEDTMKTSMLMKTVAALAIGAAFPLGAIAAPPAKTMIERGVIENGKLRVATRIAISPSGTRKEFAHNWLES